MKQTSHYNQKIVIKLGTESLSKDGKLNRGIFNSVARQIAQLQAEGTAAIIVSSGAIRSGVERLGRLRRAHHVESIDKKIIAGIGSPFLMKYWSDAFEKYKIFTSQFWVTHANMENEKESRNIRELLEKCCQQKGIVPIINANDVIASEEIDAYYKGIGENDELAAMVANLVGANSILFITTAGGVFEEDPARNPHARKYRTINAAAAKKILSRKNGKSSGGTGGINAKLKWALERHLAGMRVGIADPSKDSIVNFALGNKPVGTVLGEEVHFYSD